MHTSLPGLAKGVQMIQIYAFRSTLMKVCQLWRGGVMATLDMFWLIHTTSVLSNADTEDKAFTLILREAFPNPEFELFLQFPKPSYDDRERGRTDQFRFNIDQAQFQIPMESLNPRNFVIRTAGSDMWLPESIWIVGRDVNRNHRLLVAIPFWPSHLQFSQDDPGAAAQHSLDEA
jgi:hypothetical protein